jgi:hypothetical protein
MKLMDSINNRILTTPTSIVTVVNEILQVILDVIVKDITASQHLYLQLREVYSQQAAYLARGLVEPMTLSANLMSQVYIITHNAARQSGNTVLPEELAKVSRLQVSNDELF